jgi:hypothetical protein
MSNLLRQMSAEVLTPSEFADYILDYYNNPIEYGIDTESDYYIAIEEAYGDIKEYYVWGEWNISQVRNTQVYKDYIK